MKKILLSIATIVSMIAINSCNQRDVVTPAVVQDSQQVGRGIRTFNFSVLVLSNIARGAKQEAVSGAVVTASNGTSIQTVTTGADGIAYFTNLNEGNVEWNINAGTTSGLAQVSGTTKLEANSAFFDKSNNSNQIGLISHTVKLPTLNANIKGFIVADDDFNVTTNPTPVAGANVRLFYKSTNQTDKGIAGTPTDGNFYYPEPNFYQIATGTDGTFSFANVPSLNNINNELNAILQIDYYKVNNGLVISFTGSFTVDMSNSAAKTIDLGQLLVTPKLNNTATITGLIFGDFGFANKFTVATSTNLGGAANPSRYLLGLAGVNTVNGIISLTASNGSFGPFVANVVSSAGSLIGTQIAGVNGIGNVGITSEATVAGTVFATGGTITGIGLVSGTNTILGVVRRDVTTGNLTTVFGNNMSFGDFFTNPGFSANDIINKNTIGGSLAQSYVITNGSLVAAPALPAPTTFTKSGITVILKTTGIPGFQGNKTFSVNTAADGTYTFANIPEATYDISILFQTKFTRPDGYSQTVDFTIPAQTAVGTANKVTDKAPILATY
ncbi:MAG: hypothetical protein SFY32_09745 [Bacteroidota bacterium]|nr:hypothetical protein [Bacteroidota bacterium]